MSAILYWLGVMMVLVFCLNFANVFFISLTKLNDGKATSDDKGLVFSFLFGIIGYLLVQLMGRS